MSSNNRRAHLLTVIAALFGTACIVTEYIPYPPGADFGASAPAAPATPAASCSDYCAKVMSACNTTATQQFADSATCLGYCNKVAWPSGAVSDTSGNTIGCRTYHATAAMSDPTTHCPHAGPSGGNMCGDWCQNYCFEMAANCSGANAVYSPADCSTKCATMPTTGKANDSSGNTVQCRIYHLGVPASMAPATHCPHGETDADNPQGPCS